MGFTMLLTNVNCLTVCGNKEEWTVQALMSSFSSVLSLDMIKCASLTNELFETNAANWFARSGTGLDQLLNLVIR